MATIVTLAEQVLRRLNGGNSTAAQIQHLVEIKESVKQHINQLLKVEYYNEVLPTGETIPDGCVLATYDEVEVVAWREVSKSVLPAIPVRLPRNMGVFHIGKTGEAFDGFIPMKMGVFSQVKQQRLISDVLGQIGYEVQGKEVVYSKNLLAIDPMIEEVTMRLIVSDINIVGDYDLLPINADMEKIVVDGVYAIYAPEPQKPKIATSV